MKIVEIEWIKENVPLLSASEYELLDAYKFFDQVKEGEFDMPLKKFIEMLKVAIDIYNNYNEPVSQ